MAHSPNFTKAATWLADNGPGLEAMRLCRERFKLSPVETGRVCALASTLRAEQYSNQVPAKAVQS